MFAQASSQLHDVAIQKIKLFISENVVPNATKAIGFLCGNLGGMDAHKRLAAFLPLCRDKILTELEGGASATPSGSHSTANTNPFGLASMADAPFHYYQAILNYSVLSSGDALLVHKKDLTNILEKTLAGSASRRGYKWSAKLLKNVLLSLGTVYPREFRTHSVDEWDSPGLFKDCNKANFVDFQAKSSTLWGSNGNDSDLKIAWHQPSADEVSFAVELISSFSTRILSLLQETLLHPGSDFGHQMSRYLCWLKSIIVGIFSLLEPQPSEAKCDPGNLYLEPHQQVPIQAGYAVLVGHPFYAILTSVKEQIGTMLASSINALRKDVGEDSIEAIKSLIKAIQLFMVYRGMDPSKFDGFTRVYKYTKGAVKSAEDRKRLPRPILVKRVYLLHLARLRYNSTQASYEPVYDDFAEALYHFSISKYSQIRKQAQSAFNRILRSYPAYKYVYFPKLLDVVASEKGDEKDEDIIEAATQALRSSVFLAMGLRQWEFAQTFLKSVVKAEKIDKVRGLPRHEDMLT